MAEEFGSRSKRHRDVKSLAARGPFSVPVIMSSRKTFHGLERVLKALHVRGEVASKDPPFCITGSRLSDVVAPNVSAVHPL